jgi:hypothetical protein
VESPSIKKETNIMYASNWSKGFQYNASTTLMKEGPVYTAPEDKGESWALMSDWNKTDVCKSAFSRP